MKTYYYIVDLDERGIFKAHVECAKTEKEIYSIDSQVSEDGLIEIIEDGYMDNIHDMDGLTDYLVELGILSKGDEIIWKG